MSDQSDALVLEGEVRNFSTEVRWNHIAHTSAWVTLRDPVGRQRLTKETVAREQTFEANFGSEEALEKLMNVGLKRFAETLASDPDAGCDCPNSWPARSFAVIHGRFVVPRGVRPLRYDTEGTRLFKCLRPLTAYRRNALATSFGVRSLCPRSTPSPS